MRYTELSKSADGTAMKTSMHLAENGDGILIIPDEIMADVGLAIGDTLEVFVREHDGDKDLVLRPYYCPEARTVVQDRHGGRYSGAKYVAWPLPFTAISAQSQGSDGEAERFWTDTHLVGKGATPDAALQDLEHQVASGIVDDTEDGTAHPSTV